MNNITKITPNIFRLTVPYKDIYTTVLIIRTAKGTALFDTATYETDVINHIIPALNTLQVQDLKYIVLSHDHGDHSGGLDYLVPHFPDATIVSASDKILEKYKDQVISPADKEIILDILQIHRIPGHTPDAIGLLDTRTNTMLTGDSLQLYGLYGSGKWGANICLISEHLQALEKLSSLQIDRIVASHDYHPCGYISQGEHAVATYISTCKEALLGIKAFIINHPDMDDDRLERLYVAETGLPLVGNHVFSAVRSAINDGKI